MADHIALLGDSIFDNAAYTDGLPDVVTHLRRLVPSPTQVTLLAIDGSTTKDVRRQLAELPTDVGRAAISMGGNDAILEADALDLPIDSTKEALAVFGGRSAAFEDSYRTTLAMVLERVPRSAVCTIYDPRLPGDEALLSKVALAFVNDVILRVAFEFRLPVIDLRLAIVNPEDYANALEPSSRGAAKIASAIAAALGVTTDRAPVSAVFGPGDI